MYYNRTVNNKISCKGSKNCLKIGCQYLKLLDKNKSFSSHCQNLRYLLQKCIKYILMLPLTLGNKYFSKKNKVSYEFTENAHFTPQNIKSVYDGSETISYLGPKIWNLVPDNIKDSQNVSNFESKIKFWKLKGCSCWLHNIYLPQRGFIWLQVFSKFPSRFGHNEQTVWFMFLLKTSGNLRLSDIFRGNKDWFFWICLMLDKIWTIHFCYVLFFFSLFC